MKPQVCPSHMELAEFDLGRLPAARREEIADHLDACESCSAAFASLEERTDDLIGHLRNPLPEEIISDDTELDQLIDQAAAQYETSADGFMETATALPPLKKRQVDELLPEILTPPEAEDELGRLGGYRVLEVFGIGGMGVVFKAEDPGLNRFVALKAIKVRGASVSDESRERFLREARATAAIRHDNIVTIHQVGEDRGIPFLAMELLEGDSLAQQLRRTGRPTVEEALRIAREIALGLSAAHAKGLTHRDIKPDNIWVEADSGRVKILDFGLARANDDELQLTQSGAIVGTPGYLSPEQACGEGLDERTDLFSLGVVLYEMLTGQKPFERVSLMAVLNAIGNDTPSSPRVLDQKIPEAVSNLVMRLLEKNPDRRFQTAQDVVAAITDCETRGSNLHAVAEAPSITLDRKPSKETPRRFTSWRTLAGTGVLIAVALVATAFVFQTVFFFQTKSGTLRIEITDPKIEVSIRGTKIVLKGANKKDITLQPGDKILHVKRGDFKFDTKSLQLKKGETVVVKVELIDGTVQVASGGKVIGTKAVEAPTNVEAPANIVQVDGKSLPDELQNPYAKDREVAEWVLSVGGAVGIEPKSTGEHLGILAPSELPDQPFALFDVKLFNNRRFSNDDLERLTGLPHLTELDISNSLFDAQGLPIILRCPFLEDLNVGGTSIRSADLLKLRSLRALSCLAISTDQIDEWTFLSELPQVRHLVVGGHNTSLIASLDRVPRLLTLHFKNLTTLDTGPVTRLQKNNPNLRVVVGNKKAARIVGDDPLVELARPLTEHGWLMEAKFFKEGYLKLNSPTAWETADPFNIIRLQLPAGARLTDQERRIISLLSAKFYGITARGAIDTDLLAPILAECHASGITLTDSDLSDEGLAVLAKHVNLERLEIRGTKVTEEGVKAFKRRVPICRVESNFGTFEAEHRFPDAHATKRLAQDPFALDRKVAEWVLSRGGRVYVGSTGISDLNSLPDEDFFVQTVYFGNGPRFTGTDLKRLADLPGLLHARFDSMPFESNAFQAILKCRRLEKLTLFRTPLRSLDFRKLHKQNVTYLSVSSDQIDDEWAFVSELPRLRHIEVFGKDVPAMAELGRHEQIQVVEMPELTALEPTIVSAMQANLNLRIIVGEGDNARVLGRDPVTEAARRVIQLGWKLDGSLYDKTKWKGELPARAYTIGNVTLPPGSNPTAEDLRLLPLLSTSYFSIQAPALQNADSLAAILDSCASISKILLQNSDLSDQGLAKLPNRVSTGLLDIRGTKVTRAGIEAFKRRHPTCKVESDFGTFEAEHRFPEDSGAASGSTGAGRTEPPPTDPYAKDREVAERVLSKGGHVLISQHDKDNRKNIYDVKEIPEGDFQIESVHLDGYSTTELAELRRLPRLFQLSFDQMKAESDLDVISGCKLLVWFSIYGSSIRSSELSALKNSPMLRSLKVLRLIVDDEFEALTQLKRLRHLVIQEQDANVLRHIGHLKQLRVLELPAVRSIDEDVLREIVNGNPTLRIVLGSEDTIKVVGDDPVIQIAQQLRDKGIEFWGKYSDTRENWASAKDFPPKRVVNIESVNFPTSFEVGNSESLLIADLSYKYTEIRAEGLSNSDSLVDVLASNCYVRNLNLLSSDLTDNGLGHLQELSSLHTLDVRGTKVTKAGIEEFKRHVPICVVTSDFGTFGYEHKLPVEPTERGGQTSTANPYAKDREVAEWAISQGGIAYVGSTSTWRVKRIEDAGSLPNERFSLQSVSFSNRGKFNPGELERFIHLPGLLHVEFGRMPFDSIGLQVIAKCRRLESVTLSETSLRSSDFRKLKSLAGLRSIYISSAQVDDEWAFLADLPTLRNLKIDGERVPALSELGRYTHLQVVELSDLTELDPSIVAELHESNPNLRIIIGRDENLRIVGRDPVVEEAQKAARRGWHFDGVLLRKFAAWNSSIPDEPFRISGTKLPAGTALTDDDLRRLPLLTSRFNRIDAPVQQNADRLASVLSSCATIKTIELINGDLSDEGLGELAKRNSLFLLDVRGTEVTQEGIKAFKRRIPTCKVESDFGTFEAEHRFPDE